MKMKLSILLALSVISLVSFGQGRRNMDPEEMAKNNTAMMKDSLDLSSDQLKKVEEINLEAAIKMNKAFEEATGDRESMRATMGKLNEETNKKFKVVLTESQWNKYEVILEERRKLMRERRGGGGAN